VRLQAFLARAGAAPSRRKAETPILAGRVSVNGRTATLGTDVTPEDCVQLDGRPVTLPATTVYLAMNKPAGYLTTLKDEPGRNRKTVRDLMPDHPGLVPAGLVPAGQPREVAVGPGDEPVDAHAEEHRTGEGCVHAGRLPDGADEREDL